MNITFTKNITNSSTISSKNNGSRFLVYLLLATSIAVNIMQSAHVVNTAQIDDAHYSTAASVDINALNRRDDHGHDDSCGDHTDSAHTRFSIKNILYLFLITFIVLVASLLGLILPKMFLKILVKFKAILVGCVWFSSGVILSTGLIHTMVHAFEYLTNECVTKGIQKGTLTSLYNLTPGLVVLIVMLIMHFILVILEARNACKLDDNVSRHQHNTNNHSHSIQAEFYATNNNDITNNSYKDDENDNIVNNTTTTATDNASFQNLEQHQNTKPEEGSYYHNTNNTVQQKNKFSSNNRNTPTLSPASIVSIEAGLIIHSVFIGFGIGVSSEYQIPFIVAICMHQLFEGISLASRLLVAYHNKQQNIKCILGVAILFALSTPLSLLLGGIMALSINFGSYLTLIVKGVFNAIAAGVLLYSGLTDLDHLSHDPAFLNGSVKFKTACLLALYLGTILMSLVGIFEH